MNGFVAKEVTRTSNTSRLYLASRVKRLLMSVGDDDADDCADVRRHLSHKYLFVLHYCAYLVGTLYVPKKKEREKSSCEKCDYTEGTG